MSDPVAGTAFGRLPWRERVFVGDVLRQETVGGALLLINTTDWGLAGVFYAAAFGMAIYGIIMVSALKLGAFRRGQSAS